MSESPPILDAETVTKEAEGVTLDLRAEYRERFVTAAVKPLVVPLMNVAGFSADPELFFKVRPINEFPQEEVFVARDPVDFNKKNPGILPTEAIIPFPKEVRNELDLLRLAIEEFGETVQVTRDQLQALFKTVRECAKKLSVGNADQASYAENVCGRIMMRIIREALGCLNALETSPIICPPPELDGQNKEQLHYCDARRRIFERIPEFANALLRKLGMSNDLPHIIEHWERLLALTLTCFLTQRAERTDTLRVAAGSQGIDLFTLQRIGVRTRRDKACPCGSGKMRKNCCRNTPTSKN